MRKIYLTALVMSIFGFVRGQETNAFSEYFGDIKARHIGPALMSGRIADIEGHPVNSQVIYVGTAGGGVWKSLDAGLTFNSVFDKYCQSIGAVAIDPSDPDNTVWVGTGEVWTRNSVSIGDGIYKTSDGGKSWSKMGLEKSERISSICIHPKDPKTVYVGVLGALWGDSQERGVYKTTDGGQTWEKILYVNPGTGCSELIIDPRNPDVLYAAFWEFRRTAWSFSSGGLNSALYKTTDGGKTWNKIHTGFPAGKLGRIAVALAPSDSKILYAVVEAEKDDKKGLYRSDDAGANWKFLNGDFALTVRPFYFSRIAVDPKNPDIVSKAGLFGSISRDGGKTFKGTGSTHADIHDIWFDPNDSQRMYMATDGGLYRSLNGGQSFQINENLPVSQFYHVSVDNRTPYYVFGGLQDNNSWFGPSSSPGGVEARDWELVGAGDGFRVYPHPSKPHIVYSEMQGAEVIWRYDSQTRQIKYVQPVQGSDDPKLRFNWNAAMTTSTHNPDRLYVGSQFLHLSNDMGNSWIKISPDLTTNDKTKQNQEASGGLSADNSGAENHCTIFTIAESPLNEKVIWVGTDDGLVQLTRDGGKTWTNLTAAVSGLPANTWCYHIEASMYNEACAYAVFDGHTRNDMKPYIFKTTDYGKTWTSIVTNELPVFARSLQEDLTDRDLLYVGTEFGLYISPDAGKTWSRFDKNVPAVSIHYLEMHPQTHDLIMATHGRGIIILDNASILSEIKGDALTKPLVFLSAKPFIMPEKASFGGTSTEHQFVGDNASEIAKISYFLPKRHTFGKMTMEVYDAAGNLVSKLQPGKQKGINTVDWSFNSLAPKVAKGKTLAGAAMFVPRVAAGKYTVRVTKGSDVFEQVIDVQYDPASPFTLEERAKQQKTTRELFDFTQELAYFVYKLDTWDQIAETILNADPRAPKFVKEYGDAIDKIREKMVVTKGDNYVGQGEPQLREKLGTIYSSIGSYYGAPSESQLDNVRGLRKLFEEEKSRFEKLQQENGKKLDAELTKRKMPVPVVMSYEEFLKAD